MVWLPCPYLGREVELTAERERHIRAEHPAMLSGNGPELALTLADPDEDGWRAWRQSELLFVRGIDDGLFVVVVTVDDEPVNDTGPARTWVATAYVSEYPPLSEIQWAKS
jgi:hypothetical protein